MTKILMSASMLTSMTFTQLKHPLAKGMMLLIQTMLVCLMSGTMYKSFSFSFILFMIMVAGMLVLFMYMTSLASNEMFSPSNKMIATAMLMTPTLMYLMPSKINNKELNEHETMMENEITTTSMYNRTMGTMTLLVMYMLLTLIVVVNIINVSSGPQRHSK